MTYSFTHEIIVSSGVTIDQLCIYIVLFADDADLFSETAEGSQASLNELFTYRTVHKANLYVDIDKTRHLFAI